LWVGFDGDNYTGVSINDVTNGHNQISNFSDLFTISNVSSLTTLQTTVTAESKANYANSAGNADTVDSEHASTFAHRAAANNLVHSGNEITMIPDSFSGGLWFNYQSVGRNSSANITQYNFGDGKGGSLASITSGTFNGSCTGSAGSVAWANVTGKSTTLSGYGITDGLYSTQVSVDQNNVTWAKATAKTNRRAFIYNTSGTEYSYLFGFSSANTSSGDVKYGAVLKMGYGDTYLRILRVYQGSWFSTDWEKISAGYADSAGSVAWTNVSGRPTDLN